MATTDADSYVEMEAGGKVNSSADGGYVDMDDAKSSTETEASEGAKDKAVKGKKKPAEKFSITFSDMTKKLFLVELASASIIVLTSIMIFTSQDAEEQEQRYMKENKNNGDNNENDKNAKNGAVAQTAMTFSAASPFLQYAWVVGLVSFILCLVMRAIEKFRPGTLSQKVVTGKDFTIEAILGGFMMLWWFVGALVMTFYGPFVEATDGYFAAWLGLFASVIWASPLVFASAEKKATGLDVQHRYMAILIVCSFILIIASVPYSKLPSGILGLTCGGISAVVSGGIWVFTEKMAEELLRGLATTLSIMWIFAVGVLTYYGPFTHFGNGFVACWAGAFSAVCYWRGIFESQPEA